MAENADLSSVDRFRSQILGRWDELYVNEEMDSLKQELREAELHESFFDGNSFVSAMAWYYEAAVSTNDSEKKTLRLLALADIYDCEKMCKGSPEDAEVARMRLVLEGLVSEDTKSEHSTRFRCHH